jgi:cyclophilin family peptidyl-prolyl cis-trans isomerase
LAGSSKGVSEEDAGNETRQMVSSQEQRSISAPLSRRQRPKISFCSRLPLLFIMLTPLIIVLIVIYFLSAYHTLIEEEEEQQQQNSVAPMLTRAAEMSIQNLRARENKHVSQQEQAKVQMHNVATRVNKAVNNEVPMEWKDNSTKETLILSTSRGKIRIVLRPDLSPGSVDYIHRLVESNKCHRCNFYRAEKPGILQGVMDNKQIEYNKEFGVCPPGSESVQNKCPEWDTRCGCHGPVMTRGAAAWAAGQAGGPDFFIDNYKNPTDKFWGTQHTNFGFIEDEESFAVIDQVWDLPMDKNGGMHVLKNHIPFKMELEWN